MRLVLASASPRRQELLRAAGLTFETCAVDVDESTRPGESASAYVRRLATEKSARAQLSLRQKARQRQPRRLTGRDVPIIIGADTAVVVDGDILGKPRDAADAASMLRRLSGTWHEVMTGVSVRRGPAERGTVEVTRVFFTSLSEKDVTRYLKSGEGRDKAGGYAIQGLASRFIPRIEGSYTNVVGLPVPAVFELLEELRSGRVAGRVSSR